MKFRANLSQMNNKIGFLLLILLGGMSFYSAEAGKLEKSFEDMRVENPKTLTDYFVNHAINNTLAFIETHISKDRSLEYIKEKDGLTAVMQVLIEDEKQGTENAIFHPISGKLTLAIKNNDLKEATKIYKEELVTRSDKFYEILYKIENSEIEGTESNYILYSDLVIKSSKSAIKDYYQASKEEVSK